ncbi:MAG: hypothetical protein WCA44_18045 [Acidobacteriaceae bacterium]
MSSVYLAGRYSRRNELCALAIDLTRAGFRVTSRWLGEDKPLDTKLGDDSPAFYLATAHIDIEDICRADTLLFFAEDPHTGTPRGGRHVEFGFALGLGKRVVVIGGHENIFHYLPHVLHYACLADFIEMEGHK